MTMKQKLFILITLVVFATILPLNGLVAAQATTLPTVTIRATDPNAAEKGSTGAPDPGTFTVYRTTTPCLSCTLTVYYSLSGTATNGFDYASLTGKVTILGGATSATIVVNPIDDTLHEGTETVLIACPNPPTSSGCYNIGTPSSATVFIADND
jgi:serralysin